MTLRPLRSVAAALAGLLALGAVATSSAAPAEAHASYVVRGADLAATADAVAAVGATSVRELPLVGGVVADLGPTAVAALERAGHVVTPDHVLRFASVAETASAPTPTNGHLQVAAMTPPDDWDETTGTGVTVALLDTGVTEVPGLAGRVTHGLNLSGEDHHLDSYGHGTFMAGLIAGDGASNPAFRGTAPGAEIVSVKLAGRDGVTSLSRVLEGIGWVIANQDEYGIRVLSLSLGVPTRVAPQADPLSAAVQAAWASGITVVVAAGNEGPGTVTSPGRDPWVVSVGALDVAGTLDRSDDRVADWSGSGRVASNVRPDVVAPGVSTVSLRAPGSYIDTHHPEGRIVTPDGQVSEHHFRGSGTSMSTALVAGAAAGLLESRAFATPDDVKGALASTGVAVAGSNAPAVDLAAADAAAPDPRWRQKHPIAFNGLDGRIHGNRMPWDQRNSPGVEETWARARWVDGTWERARWVDGAWERARWVDGTWERARWVDGTWERARWVGDDAWLGDGDWSRARWVRARWVVDDWSRARWVEANFERARWVDANFQRARWVGSDWSRARWVSAGWPDGGDAWSRAPWAGAPDPR